MFGGDEVGALVMDMGSTNTRFGYAGEDTPKAYFPTLVGSVPGLDSKAPKQYIVGNGLTRYRADVELSSPVQHGLVKDWDAVERLWNHGLEQLSMKPEHPLMVSEPAFNTAQHRAKHCELLFESLEAPAVFFASDAVLTAFSCGRSSALVIDCGGGKTSVVPVNDGYVLHKGVKWTSFAGDAMARQLQAALWPQASSMPLAFEHQRTHIPGMPSASAPTGTRYIACEQGGYFSVAKRAVPATDSYRWFMSTLLLRDLTSQPCFVVPRDSSIDPHVQLHREQYELPDGTMLDIGRERYRMPELLFTPSALGPLPESKEEPPFAGIAHMANASMAEVDVDLKKELYANIIVTGANSVYNNLPARLQTSLKIPNSQANAMKVKVVAQTNSDRMFGAWMGGSILASLGSFHQMWFSQSEYQEHGASILAKKCP